MKKELLNRLFVGINADNYIIFCKIKTKGRFKEEENFEIFVKENKKENFLMTLKVFYGKKPYYKAWIEAFNINPFLNFNKKINYFNSIIEDKLIEFLSNILEEGEKIYIEYFNDEETNKQLEINLPIPLTRLGYKLFLKGFTWFKDWYFPEGFMEGNFKLQGEKPLNENIKRKHLKEILKEIQYFLNNIKYYKNNIILKGIERAKNLKFLLNNKLTK